MIDRVNKRSQTFQDKLQDPYTVLELTVIQTAILLHFLPFSSDDIYVYVCINNIKTGGCELLLYWTDIELFF